MSPAQVDDVAAQQFERNFRFPRRAPRRRVADHRLELLGR